VEDAGRLAAAVIDSALQPSRLELLDEQALEACGLAPAPAGLAISFGSVEPAVRAQQATVAEMAGQTGGCVEALPPEFWRTYDRMLAGRGVTRLRIATLATRTAATLAEARASLAGAAGVTLTACVPLGALRVAVEHADPARLAGAVERLRAFVAPDEGSVVIERAGAALRARVDPWGPVPPAALDLMRALKLAFDPQGTLNPGRFVGGL
jgi:glycolate dehydrogenase FAD-binding subunit